MGSESTSRTRPTSFIGELGRGRIRLERVDVEACRDLRCDRPHGPGRVGQPVATAGDQRRAAEPADDRVELAVRLRWRVDAGDQPAAAEIDVVGEANRDRQRGEGLVERPVERVDRLDPRSHV